jgi:diphthamide synthase subunit DPH2
MGSTAVHERMCGTGYAVRFNVLVCKHHADITAPVQAPASSLGMALGWARAARLRASSWTTLRVAAAVQCGCPRVSVDVSKQILTLQVADPHT